jgi:hypothetical protein
MCQASPCPNPATVQINLCPNVHSGNVMLAIQLCEHCLCTLSNYFRHKFSMQEHFSRDDQREREDDDEDDDDDDDDE